MIKEPDTKRWTNPLPGVPSVESPFFDEIADIEAWDSETRRVGTDLRERGFAVIDFPEPDFTHIAEAIIKNLGPRYDWDSWRTRGWKEREGLRIQDAWEFDANVRRLAANVKLLELLRRLYGRTAIPFQTLNFPVGTQQAIHSDSTHFSSAPERFMCGVWVALEDIDGENGPLEYYPGSQRFPIYHNEHIGAISAGSTTPYNLMVSLWARIAEKNGLRKEQFVTRKGQALIWAANLYHGGSEHKNPSRTRWSQVTHYYFDDCVYYTPITSDTFLGHTYYRELTDIATGKRVFSGYSGQRVSEEVIRNSRGAKDRVQTLLSLPEGFDPALYLKANPDVASAGVDAADHWIQFGRFENRRIR